MPTTRRSAHRLQTKSKVRHSCEHLRDIFRVTGPSYDVTDLLKVQVGRSRPSHVVHMLRTHVFPLPLRKGKVNEKKR